ncbi:hypothetical protein [Sphingobium sp. EP60837]|uniref:hypothetical protein n=1 Tax=Sphingobium sp. EP60837 TaxID=1855519 RepID=UPI0007DE24E1|nr:hypothetical protein [Sphingobium sp. EP60837]ANI80114.1 hypothetical protein EP837_03732 [Sphingobium sp. EP60837]
MIEPSWQLFGNTTVHLVRQRWYVRTIKINGVERNPPDGRMEATRSKGKIKALAAREYKMAHPATQHHETF